MTQMTFGDPGVEIPEHRVRALAGVVAGFGWPDRGTFEALKVRQKEAALRAARLALIEVMAEATSERLL